MYCKSGEYLLKTQKISKNQFINLVAFFTIGSSILIVPSGLAAEVKQDAWIVSIISALIGLLLAGFYSALGSRFYGLNLIQYTEKIFGKILGKIISFLFFSFSFLLASLVLRNIGDFITTQILPDTPIEIIHILFFAVVFIGAIYGLETIARTSEVFFPWLVFFFVIIILFVLPQIDIKKMQPVFESDIKSIIRASIPFIGTPFLELIIFLMLYPNVNHDKKGTGFITGTLISGVFLTIIITITILVLGANITAHNAFPTYALAKKISIVNYIERLEVTIAGIWIITVFFKLAILFYVSVISLYYILNLNSYKFLFIPLGMIMIVLSLISYPSTAYFQNFATKIWPFYALTFGFVYPVLLLLVSFFRKS